MEQHVLNHVQFRAVWTAAELQHDKDGVTQANTFVPAVK